MDAPREGSYPCRASRNRVQRRVRLASLKRLREFNLSHERDELARFHESLSGRVAGLIYGPKSLEDRFYITHSPPTQLAFNAVRDGLDRLGLQPKHVDPTDSSFLRQVQEPDLLFLNMHGEFGEDGRLQGLLDYLEKPYTGSGVLASAIGLNKVMFKRILTASGIDTPKFVELDIGPLASTYDGVAIRQLHFPIIIKAVSGGSSLGSRLLHSLTTAEEALLDRSIIDYGQVFAEEFIQGRSVTVGVLELESSLVAFPSIESQFDADFYDAATKADILSKGLTTYTVGVSSAELETRLRSTALEIHELIGCRGFSRVDFVVTPGGQLLVLEINTIPGMSAHSNFATGAEALGLTYDETILAMLRSCFWPE